MPTKKTAPPPAAPEAMPETYEAAMTELEQLVRSLETGQMPLE
ncbi:MAG: exodeoxyribonuclease VII small subunit, partial [Burkholderiaceae bacterium]